MKLLLALVLMASTAVAGEQICGGYHTGIDTDGVPITVEASADGQIIRFDFPSVGNYTALWDPAAGFYRGVIPDVYLEVWSWTDIDGHTQWFWYLRHSQTDNLIACGQLS